METGASELAREIEDVGRRLNLLRAGGLLHPVMDEVAEQRYGRVIAAQLAAFVARGQLWISFRGSEFPDPETLFAHRRPGLSDELDGDERLLVDLLFGNFDGTQIIKARPGPAWDDLARWSRQWLKANGLGWLTRERYRTLGRLIRLRKAMRAYMSEKPRRWSDDPDLHLAGYPLAVLFHLEFSYKYGAPRWPRPPKDELFIPLDLSTACQRAIDNAID